MASVKVEVRAVGLKAMREKHGLTQRKLAHDLGISQNYIAAIEANSRQAGPKLQQQMVKHAGGTWHRRLRRTSRNCTPSV
ncbi:MAG: helix-turn-helix transcriptional regulator [Candidatus Dormibacteraeota bacterium]|nr:helix-turn-helix transcriptional regulator [Candidatus Dormibacteraeota bacterium]